MNEQVNQLVMNADLATMPEAGLDPGAEQLQRKQRLAAALRIFGKFGFDEGVAGHITVRDPIDTDTFWVNPMGRSFKLMRVSDLIRVSHEGDIVEGEGGGIGFGISYFAIRHEAGLNQGLEAITDSEGQPIPFGQEFHDRITDD